MGPNLRIGIIGDFDPSSVPHTATNASLDHAASSLGLSLDVSWVPTPSLADRPASTLAAFDGLWCSPASPYRSMDGALAGIRFAREHGWPYFAT